MESITCNVCGNEIPLTAPKEPVQFLEDAGQWQNVTVSCPTCEKEGRETLFIINMNIPESEFEEEEVASEEFFPKYEKEWRQKIRNFMWQVRPDLKNKNRKAVDHQKKAAFEKKFGKTIDQFREERGARNGKPTDKSTTK